MLYAAGIMEAKLQVAGRAAAASKSDALFRNVPRTAININYGINKMSAKTCLLMRSSVYMYILIYQISYVN